MKERCESVYNGFRCTREKGHFGTHRYLESGVQELDNGCLSIHCLEWNDKHEVPDYREFGETFPVDYDLGEDERRRMFDIAVADAKANLPEGAVFEVRAKNYPKAGGIAKGFGRTIKSRRDMAKAWGIAWYHTPEPPQGFPRRMSHNPLVTCSDTSKGEVKYEGGYVLLARMEA